MKYLLTYSLLNSFSWFYKMHSEDKKIEFKNTLKRLSIEENEYMKAGKIFEQHIQDYCKDIFISGVDIDYDNCVRSVAHTIAGGTWQVKGYCDITIGDQEFLLYGIADVIKGPTIFDIKFVQKYEYGKYQDSEQHKVYFRLFPNMPEFRYLISDGMNVWTEHYQRDQAILLDSDIANFWSWLSVNPEYKELYQKNWNDKNDQMGKA